MRRIVCGVLKPARICGPAGFLLAGLGVLAPFAAPAQGTTKPLSDHRTALAALTDIKIAIKSIVAAEDSSSSGPGSFKADAQQAINALVGHDDPAYRAEDENSSASSADAAGAAGDIDHLLDRTASPPWVPALHDAQANIAAAVARLQDAQGAKGLMDYQIAVSQALINLEVAEGRPGDPGVFGGMEGAIANTALAVPQGAKVVDGCAAPKAAPAYGIHAGYLVFRTARPDASAAWTMNNLGGTSISSHDGFFVFNFPAFARVQQLCAAPSKPE